jgi:hypothetical protein
MPSPLMRAKLQVLSVTQYGTPPTSISISASAVTGTTPYGPSGESEDNTFARYTPSASFSASITNPALLGQIKQGDKFYVDFTKADA